MEKLLLICIGANLLILPINLLSILFIFKKLKKLSKIPIPQKPSIRVRR